ncbi:MAG: sulfatase, partial [Planctomycetota bacterium]|nr:sulfatase [Planctomycetota bacterium]
MKTSAAAGLALLLLASSCGGADEPRSALLVTLDTTRWDSLSITGAPAGLTPSLDALAEESVVYTAARTVAPLTLPSHASILTGLYPPRHTVRTNSRMALPRSATTLAEKARAAGMQTAAFVAAEVLSASFGLDQGFDHYEEPELRPQPPFERLGAEEIADRAIAWIRARDPDRPFFVWVHFFDPHWPYAAPERFVRQADGDVYLAEVARVDDAVGRIFDVLRSEGVYDDTAIVVVADHGEGLEEHDERTHGTLVYDSTLRVPLLVRYPDGHRAGERSDELVSVVDVLPTLSEAMGLAPPGDVDGQSLYRRVSDDRGLYFESYYGFYSFGWSPIAGWVDPAGKYIHSSEPELYESQDAGELVDVFAARKGELERYRDGIDAIARRSRLQRSQDDRAGSAMIDQLHSLGYAGTADGAALPHPL